MYVWMYCEEKSVAWKAIILNDSNWFFIEKIECHQHIERELYETIFKI